jgi:hypothetical protein
VAIKPFVIFSQLPLKTALCDQVIVTPEDNNIIVFNKGNPHGSRENMPVGGQIQPMSIEGAKLP